MSILHKPFPVTWKNQQDQIETRLESQIAEISGRIYFTGWRSDYLDDGALIRAFIVEDAPEITRFGSSAALYHTNTRWRFIYQFKSDPTDRSGDYLTLRSGVGGICTAFSEYQQNAALWDYAIIDHINMQHQSPDITPGVVEEGSVDVVIRSPAQG